jgi:MoaA/NifB/PqqE/SkfB family radical SAM enzyme
MPNLKACAERKVFCPDAPYTLFIEPTNICNLSCVFCPQKKQTRRRGMMDFQLFQKILADAKACGVHKINLFFLGESLLHPDIFSMLAEVRKVGLISRLNTNATLLTPEKSALLLESGLNYLTISFDGVNPESYEKLRVNASFYKTRENIATICRLKKEIGAATEIAVEMIQIADCEKLFPDFAFAMKALGVDRAERKTYRNWAGEFSENRTVSPFLSPYHICSYPWKSMAILWEGTAVPCCVDFDACYPLGHVSEGIMSLWNSEKMQLLRQTLIDREDCGDEVFDCVNKLCAGCDIPFQAEEHCVYANS